MPIIAQVGRKSYGIRFLIGAIYALLLAGTVTMVYPFLLLLSGSVKSTVDITQYDVYPRYLYDDVMLFRKYAEEKFGYSAKQLNEMYGTDFGRVEDAVPPAVYSTALLQDWQDFLAASTWPEYFPNDGGILPVDMFLVRFYSGETYRTQWMHMAWQDFLEDRYSTIENFNHACSENRENFLRILPFPTLWHTRRYRPDAESQYYKDFIDFKTQLRQDPGLRFVSALPFDGIYWSEFIGAKYGGTLAEYNRTHGTHLRWLHEVSLSETLPPSPQTPEEWQEYISNSWRVHNLRLTPRGQERLTAFLLTRYGSFEALATAYGFRGSEPEAFEVGMPVSQDEPGPAFDDFMAFLAETAPWDDVYLQTVNDWETYVRVEAGVRYLRLDAEGEAALKSYMRDIYVAAAELEPGRRPLDILADRYEIEDVSRFADIDAFLAQYRLPQPVPPSSRAEIDLDDFLRERCPLRSIRLVTPEILFAKYLEKRYGTIEDLLKAHDESLVYPMGNSDALMARLSPLGEVALRVIEERELGGLLGLFELIEREPAVLSQLGERTKEHFRAALSEGDATTISALLDIKNYDAWHIGSFRDVRPPERARDWEDVQQRSSELRRHYLTQNYRHVLREIVVHGRALFNTVVFVLAAIALALIVNPLAAYALSRYELPSTYKILLFFMATMAFPAEVTMIPNFLLLKNFPLGYLIQGAILLALFFGGRTMLKPIRPRLWAVVEGALLVGTAFLVLAALHDTGGPLDRRMQIPQDGYWHYALLPLLFLSALVLLGALTPFRWAPWLRRYHTAAWITVISILTLVFTPLVASAFGLASATTSLLNTFWALLLPGMANGFAIFLLKGFFDSLPKNLYESAQLEGASEIWMFRNVTVPLSKPILAVIALQTFTLTYTTFMYAFLVCQDERMWTMMVYIYQMQLESPQYIVFASLVIAAIPTLMVFIFAQRVIMRGIIIPVEK